MARPIKTGLDYFPLDCSPDKKLKAIIRKFGAEGYGLIISLFQHIYSDGYFIKWTCEVAEDFALEMDVEESLVDDLVSFCIKREVFDGDIFKKKKVLTSRGIQKRYLLATERRKCSQIECHNLINVDINSNDDDKNEVNEDSGTQSKVKESKVKEIITYLNDKSGKNYRASSDKSKTHINARLNEGFDVSDFETVIEIKCNEWLNTENEKFIRPETLFGNKFEGYLNQPKVLVQQKKKPLVDLDRNTTNILMTEEEANSKRPEGTVNNGMVALNGKLYFNPWANQ